jgi:murein hydrolase activator
MRFALPLMLLLLFSSLSDAAPPKDELKKIQEKIREEKKKLSAILLQESSVLNELDAINSRLSKVEAERRNYMRALRQTESEMQILQLEIDKTKKAIEKQQDWLGRKLRSMQRFGHAGDMLLSLMSAEDLSQMIRVWKYLENLTRSEHGKITEYRSNLSSLDEKSGRLRALKTEIVQKTEAVRLKELEIEATKKEKEIILSSVRNERSSRQKLLSELNESAKKLLDIIRESSKKDDYSAQGFGRLKGKLSWPSEGRVAIPYGQQKDRQFDTPVFRNGIHIQSDASADARAVFAGKVIFSEWFKGFGQLVIVNHGSGYHTLYGNLSEIFSHVGDIIKEDQVIGKVGTSGILNAPGLYFEIRYNGKPLDPLQWLKGKKR